jgi:hypothetical protein
MATGIPERVDRFQSAFVAPLLAGGRAEVSAPMSLAHLDHASLSRPVDAAIDHALHAAFHRGASAIAPVLQVPYPERGAMALAMAGHDLLALTDPLLDRWGSRSAYPTILRWAKELVTAAGAPATRGAALVRHLVVERLLGLERRDVVVRNWAYTYRFFGRDVPANVVALPKLRRVRSEESATPALELLAAVDAETKLAIIDTARALVAASPLTGLLAPQRSEGFALGPSELAILADPGLRRAVARACRAAQDERHLVALGDALITPKVLTLSPEARALLDLLFAELGAEDALDRKPGHTLERLARGRPGMQLAAGLFAVGPARPWLEAALAPSDRAIVRERAITVARSLPERALAHARRFVADVPRAPELALEDAS